MEGITAISREMLEGLKAGTHLKGVLLIQGYSEKVTKNGKPYIDGLLQSGVTVAFKCWNSSSAFTSLHNEDYKGAVAYVSGEVQEYQGTISVVLDMVQAVEGFDVSLFMKKRYNAESYWSNLRTAYLEKLLSPKGLDIFDRVFTPQVVERFKVEFAASGHHDNCLSGLLAHTYKILMFGGLIPQLYPNLFIKQGEKEISKDRVDLFILGICFHDIGKILEMNNGVYQPCSRVTHRILGLSLIENCKDAIVEAYGEIGYYDLVSVIVQHHDAYDDKARTVLAYAVFLLDNMESKFMGLQQELEERVQGTGEDSRIWFDDRYMYV